MANSNEHNVYGDFCNEHPLVGGICFNTGTAIMVMAIADLGKAAFKAVSAWIKAKRSKD